MALDASFQGRGGKRGRAESPFPGTTADRGTPRDRPAPRSALGCSSSAASSINLRRWELRARPPCPGRPERARPHQPAPQTHEVSCVIPRIRSLPLPGAFRDRLMSRNGLLGDMLGVAIGKEGRPSHELVGKFWR